jgi:hypothetical protein
MTNHADAKLDRDQQLLNRLSRIEHKVDSIDQTNAFALRADATRYLELVKKIFGDSKRRAQVYLAVDGKKGVLEIASHLKMKHPNLLGEGLLEVMGIYNGKTIWAKKTIDHTLQISRFLQKHFKLLPNGLPNPALSGKGPRTKKIKAS